MDNVFIPSSDVEPYRFYVTTGSYGEYGIKDREYPEDWFHLGFNPVKKFVEDSDDQFYILRHDGELSHVLPLSDDPPFIISKNVVDIWSYKYNFYIIKDDNLYHGMIDFDTSIWFVRIFRIIKLNGRMIKSLDRRIIFDDGSSISSDPKTDSSEGEHMDF